MGAAGAGAKVRARARSKISNKDSSKGKEWIKSRTKKERERYKLRSTEVNVGAWTTISLGGGGSCHPVRASYSSEESKAIGTTGNKHAAVPASANSARKVQPTTPITTAQTTHR